MARYLLIFFLLIKITNAGVSDEAVTSMVPRGTILEHLWNDYVLKTAAGSKIKVEFKRDGSFDEASGLNLGTGDEFEPGNGLLSLTTVAQKIKEQGTILEGVWSLEEDNVLGWVYRLRERSIMNEGRDLLISAKDGKEFPIAEVARQ